MKLAISRRRGRGRSVASNHMYENRSQHILMVRRTSGENKNWEILNQLCDANIQLPAFLGGQNATPWPYGRESPSRIQIFRPAVVASAAAAAASSAASSMAVVSAALVERSTSMEELVSQMSISDAEENDSDEERRSIDMSKVTAVPIPMNQVLDPSNHVLEATSLKERVKSSVNQFFGRSGGGEASSLSLSSTSSSSSSSSSSSAELPVADRPKVQSFRVTAGNLQINYQFDGNGKVYSYSYSH